MKKLNQTYIIIVFVLITGITQAQDKNGVTPNTISLPSGPGSIEGLGDSFQPMLNTGTSQYSVKIIIPKGINNHEPELLLQYDSGLGDGSIGLGWTIGPQAIKRQIDKGIPRYIDNKNTIDDDHDGIIDNDDEIDQIISPDGEELVHVEKNIYRARIERDFTRYKKENDYWEADLRNGNKLIFGKTHQSKITDSTGLKVYKWLLEKHIDVNGNTIEYYYSSFEGSENQKYLTEIRYAPGSPPWEAFYFVYFEYENRPDWRKDYRAGFLIKTSMRLCKINIGFQDHHSIDISQDDWNKDGSKDHLIRQYQLVYEDGKTNTHFLKQVFLYDSKAVNYLPPTSFEYYHYNPPLMISAKDALSTSIHTPNKVMDNPEVEFIDMNKDSLPDILVTEKYGNNHKVYLNLGEQGDTKLITWDEPKEVFSSDGLASKLWLENNQVFLSDMDGDGLSDLTMIALNEVKFFSNNGNLGWQDQRKMLCVDSIHDPIPPSPFGNKNVRSSDFDFNKHMDIVRSTDTGYSTWFNLGKRKYSKKINTPGAIYMDNVIRFDLPGVQLADINGDRLNDIVLIKDSTIIYCANMGYGYFDKAITISINNFLIDDRCITLEKVKISDINNDGLSDLIAYNIPGNQLWYWINYGNDSFSKKHIINDLPVNYSLNAAIRWVDINGNGSVDLVFADSSAEDRLRIIDIARLTGGSDFIHLLHKINNGLGVITTIYYQSSTEQFLKSRTENNNWDSCLPFPVTVVSKVETITGLDLDNIPGEDIYTKEYAYRNGYYDTIEKSFRGYEFTEVFEKGDSSYPGTITRHQFFTGGPDNVDNDQDNSVDEIINEKYREEDALKGMVKKVEVLSSDHLCFFSVEENLWNIKTLHKNTENIEIRYASIFQTNEKIYDCTDIPEIISQLYEYDDYGNLIKQENLGATSITGDEVITISSFINDTEKWILGKQCHQIITDVSGKKFAETKSYYDGNPFKGMSYGELTKGNLTRVEGWVRDDHYVDIMRQAFDQYGKVIGIMDANGNKRSIEYDSHLHLFPVKEKIHLDQNNPDLDLTITVQYDYKFGVITKSIDYNGHASLYTYDSFGRLTNIVKPGDSIEFPSQSFFYSIGDPEKGLVYLYNPDGKLTIITKDNAVSSIITKIRENFGEEHTFDYVQYTDGLGRKLALIEEGEQGFIVKDSIMFNSRGEVNYSFLPYHVKTSEYPFPTLDKLKHEINYDASGRTIKTINPPDKENNITEIKTQYIHLKKIISDENNNIKSVISDGLGRLIEVHEKNNDEVHITYYHYDPTGNLIKIIDPQNNIQTMLYDGLNRKTEINDPDRGKIINTYDGVGNLISKIDNKGQVIKYTYDGANRIVTEDYIDENSINPDITYYYDIPSKEYPDFSNLKGKVSWIKDLSGAQFLSYNNHGHINTSMKRIIDNETPIDYQTTLFYDAMGRIVIQEFPDNDQLQYFYNNRSLLKSIPGVVNEIKYNPSGQIDNISLNNGTLTHYEYDSRNRLEKCLTRNSVSGKIIQDLNYKMDSVGNITKIEDNRAVFENARQNATQTFQYDNIYRLISADGEGYGLINYKYDKIGNIIFKNSPEKSNTKHVNDRLINLGVMTNGGNKGTSNRSVRKPGDSPGPHAITSTESGFKYDYDANGNMIYHNGDQYKWNYLDQLVSVQKENVFSKYVYDYNGQRVIKKMIKENGETKTTYYVNKEYEVRDGEVIKYVYSGIRKLAQINGKLLNTSDNDEQIIRLKPGWNFISLELEPENPSIDILLSSIKNKFSGIWYYDSVNRKYIGYEPEKEIVDLNELHAKKAYIIHMLSESTVFIKGTQVTKKSLNLEPGWNLIPCPNNAIQSLKEALLPIHGKYDSIWSYSPEKNNWKKFFTHKPNLSDILYELIPGKSYWINMASNGQLELNDYPTQIYFYHLDHLGSANVITNHKGEIVESIEYYPYGKIRFEKRKELESYYKYTGKELDNESGLMYYEARYYDSIISKFISYDSLGLKVSKDQFNNSQLLNFYSYGNNNPIKYIDPSGNTAWDVIDVGMAAWSWYDFVKKPSLSNLGFALLDTSAVLPIIPSSGYFRNGLKGTGKFLNKSGVYVKKINSKISKLIPQKQVMKLITKGQLKLMSPLVRKINKINSKSLKYMRVSKTNRGKIHKLTNRIIKKSIKKCNSLLTKKVINYKKQPDSGDIYIFDEDLFILSNHEINISDQSDFASPNTESEKVVGENITSNY